MTCFLLMFPYGIFLIWLGFNHLTKPFSAAFFSRTPYSIARVYASIPLGLTNICWGFLPFVPSSWARLLFFGGGIIAILGTIIIYMFFKPGWLKWLEKEYGPFLPLVQEEAHKIGLDELDKQIQSRQDFEEWITELAHSQGW